MQDPTQQSQRTYSEARLQGRGIMRRWLFGAGVVWIIIIALICIGVVWASRSSTQARINNQGSTIIVSNQSISVTGDGSTENLNCSGSDVTITGDHNKVTLQGNCAVVTVSGDDNTVNGSQIGDVTATGDGNHIDWTGSITPSITDNGSANKIERGAN